MGLISLPKVHIPNPIDGINEVKDKVENEIEDAAEGALNRAGDLKDKVMGTAEGALNKAGDLKDKVVNGGKRVLDVLQDPKKAVCERLNSEARARGPQGIAELNNKIRDFFDSNGHVADGPLDTLLYQALKLANQGFGTPTDGELPAASLIAVVDGAELKCRYQSKPSFLHASGTGADAGGKPIATVDDHEPGVNIDEFGECKKVHKPCDPQTPNPWVPALADLPLTGAPALHDAAKLECTIGGGPCISIVDPGQFELSLGEASALLLMAAMDGYEGFDPEIKEKMMRDLVDGTTPTQKALLASMFRDLDSATIREALNGAHLEIHDDGALYDMFKANGSYPRSSSHKKQKDDRGLDLPGGGTILIARDKDDPEITHVQMEKHGARSHPFEHTQDWCKGKQLGPYDAATETPHNDDNPITVHP